MVNTLDQFAFFLGKAIKFTNFRENNDALVSINEQKSRYLYASYNCSRAYECHGKCHPNVRGLCKL